MTTVSLAELTRTLFNQVYKVSLEFNCLLICIFLAECYINMLFKNIIIRVIIRIYTVLWRAYDISVYHRVLLVYSRINECIL